ncbi:response regulator [Methyloversatilis thermotolerans]|uniref:response regulator n=1 Tax=Methyloversatilis thermotolerans TaxID=1346290 RepID=UPI0003646BF9|nr:response regulator [Methyloversatilis thermotolerans]
MSPSSRPSSIAGLLIVLIVTTVSLLLAAVGALLYRSYSEAELREFEQAMDMSVEQLAVGLVPAAWNLDYEQVRKLMESRMRDRSIAGVEVQLDTARLAFARAADGAPQAVDGVAESPKWRVRERPILSGEQPIGTVRVIATPEYVEQELRGTLVSLVLFIVALDAVLTMALYIALQRMVLQPLREVERHADEVAREGRSQRELGSLRFAGELHSLTRSLDAMVSQLEARNAELAASNERFQRVIRLLPLPISLFERNGRIVYLNESFVATFGYTLDDIPDAETWFRLAYPDPVYREEVQRTWAQDLADAPLAAGLVKSRPYSVICKDGSRKIVEIGGMMSEDPNITILSDITDRRRAEEELAQHQEHLEELVSSRTAELESTNRRLEETQFALDHAGVAIQWIDAASGRFSYVNDRACALYGRSRAELLGTRVGDVLIDIAGDDLAALEPALRERGHARIETIARRGDGSEVPVEVGIYFGPPSSGQNDHCIAFSMDITQRKEAEAALISAKLAAEGAAQARSEFLANMSHEIRTPMNAIIGMTRLALQTDLDARQRNYIGKANGSAISLLGILNDILDFSKVEAGQLVLESMSFRLERVFESLLSVVALRAEEKGLDLLLDVAPDVPPVLVGDPLRLGQILTNLVGNAIKFTERGAVHLSCRRLDQEDGHALLAFAVRDTGIGMSRAQQDKLFQPFTQGDSSITRRFGGTGLGLAISRRLAELMNGRLQVSSREGVGTTFTFVARFATAELPDADRRVLPPALRDARVLVVDDNSEALDILCRDIEHLGLRTIRASSAQQALERMDSGTAVDLLVCDWKMPGMDGVELVRRMQSSARSPLPPAVLMVSAYGADDMRDAARGLEIAGVLTKPASASALHDAIVTAFGLQSAGQGAPPVPSAPDDVAILRGRRVLLVEDNPINQELGVELLQAVGMEVVVADNGAEALRHLDATGFDLVLMDVQMPVMNGLDATREIRRREHLRELPVIAMTAGAMPWEREQTRQAGMSDHITKPVDVDILMATLCRWLGDRPGVAEPVASSIACAPDDVDPLLDRDGALRRLNGAEATYRRALTLFIDESVHLRARMRTALAHRDMQALAGLAHRARGSAAALGANRLAVALRRVEDACRQAEAVDLNGLLRAGDDLFDSTLDAMRNELARPPASSVAEPLTEEDIARLYGLLESNDSESTELLSALLERPRTPEVRQTLKQMSRAMERYDFDSALALMTQLRAPTGDPDTRI